MSREQIGSLAFAAMGTQVEVHAEIRALAPAVRLMHQVFLTWETSLSRFRPASELSRLNAAAGRPFAASELLYKVVAHAVAWAQATEGSFDPAMLRQIEQLGYDRTFTAVPRVAADMAPAAGVRQGGSWRSIAMEPGQRLITLPEGVGLDLGGIAKGMAVDAALAALARHSVPCVLVNAGGDLAVLGRPPGLDGWPVGVPGLRHPIVLREGAVATSGTSRRRWLQGGEVRHHLLDPATGLPAREEIARVTVVAANCEAADVAATTAFVRGVDAGRVFLAREGMAGLFVTSCGMRLPAGSWPQEAG